MNKITIVNENNEVVGSADVEEAVEKKLIRRVARVFLIRTDGRIFLQKRSSSMELYPGRWDQSAGGHVDEGETFLEAARRELSEELGLTGMELEKISEPFYLEENTSEGVIKSFNMVYKALYDEQDIDLQKREVMDGDWFSPEEIDEMINKEPESFSEGFIATWNKYKDTILDSK